MTDVAGANENGVLDLLHMITDNAYPLHRAAISEKDSTFFNCNLIFMTSNRTHFGDLKSLYCKEALDRRIQTYCLVPKPDYCKPESLTQNLWDRRIIDTHLLPRDEETGTPDMSIYEFHLWDPMQGVLKGGCMTYMELEEDIVKRVQDREREYERNTGFRLSLRMQALAERRVSELPPLVPYRDHTTAKLPPMGAQMKLGEWFFGATEDGGPPPDLLVKDAFKYCNAKTAEEQEALLNKMINKLAAEQAKKSPKEKLDDLYHTFFSSVEAVKVESAHAIKALQDDISTICTKWLNKPANRNLLLIAGLCTTFTIAWHFAQVHFKEQSGEFHGREVKPLSRAERRKARLEQLKKQSERPDAPQTTQGANFTDNLQQLSNSLWRKNLWTVMVDDSVPGYVLFIKGRQALMNKHFTHVFDKKVENTPNFSITLALTSNPHQKVTVEWRDCEYHPHVSQDYVVVKFPRVMELKPDIRKHIVSREVDLTESAFYAALLVAADAGFGLWPSFAEYVGNMSFGAASSAEGYVVKVKTREGHCGLPYITADEYINTTKIIAIHAGGNTDHGAGYGTAIFIEEIEPLLFDEDKDLDIPLLKVPFTHQMSIAPQFNAIGFAEPIVQPTKHEKRKSALFGAWGPSSMGLSRLKPFEKDGEIINPMSKAVQFYCTNTSPINLKLLKACTNSYISRMFKHSEPLHRDPRIFDFETAIVGIPGYIDGIPMDTSAGYDWNSRGISKKDIFQRVDGVVDFNTPLAKELKEKTLAIEESLRAGIKVDIIQTDYLKSETLPLEKVMEGKTRLFSAGQLEWFILFRMYLLDFVQWTIENRVVNGLTIGINCYSTEWNILASHMMEHGDNIIAGDFKKWDARITVPMIYALFDVIDRFYVGATEEEKRVRRLMCEAMCSTIHLTNVPVEENGKVIYKTVMYEWVGAMASGLFLTGSGNSIMNNIILRYACVDILTKKSGGARIFDHTSDFDFVALESNVNIVANGDDNLLGVGPEYLAIDQLSLAESLAKIGMEYTEETKQGRIQPHRSITEVEFLKRRFRWEEAYGRFVSPLRMASILEAPYWCNRKPKKVDLEQCVRTNVLELALHGQEVFEEWAPKIIDASQRVYSYVPEEVDWEIAIDRVLRRKAILKH
jgi:hypothetical protein